MSAFCGQPKPQVVPCRQYCAICGNLYAVDYNVTDQDIWDEAIHPHYRGTTVCLECFIRRADEKELQWDTCITFYPCSAYSMIQVRNRAAIGAAIKEKP